MGPATRYTLLRNTASRMKILILFLIYVKQLRSQNLLNGKILPIITTKMTVWKYYFILLATRVGSIHYFSNSNSWTLKKRHSNILIFKKRNSNSLTLKKIQFKFIDFEKNAIQIQIH